MVRLPMRVRKGRLTPLESADPHSPPLTPLECADQKSPRFKSFIMNRSKKPGGGGGSRPRDRSPFPADLSIPTPRRLCFHLCALVPLWQILLLSRQLTLELSSNAYTNRWF